MFQTVVPARVLSLETPDHLVRDQRLSVRDRERILNDLKAGIYDQDPPAEDIRQER